MCGGGGPNICIPSRIMPWGGSPLLIPPLNVALSGVDADVVVVTFAML